MASSTTFPSAPLPPPGEILLITDQLLSPADFFLHRFLTSHLKGSPNATSVLVSLSEDLTRWKAIAGRLNANLSTYIENRSLTVIDAMAHIDPAPEACKNSLRALFTHIQLALALPESEKNAMVILDDLAAFEWIGIQLEQIVRFARALCALCRKAHASLMIRHHIVTPGEPDELFKRLLQLCHHQLDVFPLTSGRSGSVSGQVSLHTGTATMKSTYPTIPRSAAILYRLTDTGSVFFERGTGSGVL